MKKHSAMTLATLAVVAATGLRSVAGQGSMQGSPMAPHQMSMAGAAKMMTKDQKIANATSAGPASVTDKATILDWPAKEGDSPSVLRAGSNGWSCLPDMPDTQGTDPMCLDQPWMKWVEAYLAHKPLQITSVGIGYMLAPGGAWGSNTDPYAMAAAPGNQWGLHPPHVMILVPDLKALEGISSDPNNGGPYVMFKGTPYAHIMAPIAGPAMGGRSVK